MAESRYSLLANDERPSLDSTTPGEGEETLLPGGFATTSPSRPFATSYHPTIWSRGLALILAIPAFIIFIVNGRKFSPSIVFLSFAIFRQVVVLGAHFITQVIVVRIEVVHPRLKAASAKAQEKWIKRGVSLLIDGGILIGLLASLAVVAHGIQTCHYYGRYSQCPEKSATAAVVLGFIAFGLLLNSILDFGVPSWVTLSVAVETPASGIVKLSTNVLYGETDDAEENGAPSTRETPDNTYRDHEDSTV
ncbi:hypothetical protein BJ875DRAFT_1711 [Amylocarpus encephaloides]|uniref:Transmembrane protein n=1 Tax=Amylocarpus encephaloides TaxID=45428 RepID=A0A9P8CC00_9HELO|nr:hypothetical protein BJ875DRAFT_1711 [Amylocarpus encephaloides]